MESAAVPPVMLLTNAPAVAAIPAEPVAVIATAELVASSVKEEPVCAPALIVARAVPLVVEFRVTDNG